MKFKRRLKQGSYLSEISSVSFLNVLLLFFAFLMLGSGFTIVPGVNVKLPDVITAKELRFAFYITISKEGGFYVRNKPAGIEEIKAFLKKNTYDSVFIKADKDSRVDALTKIWEICKEAGIEKISFVTTQ